MVIYPLVLPVPPPLEGVGGTRALAHFIIIQSHQLIIILIYIYNLPVARNFHVLHGCSSPPKNLRTSRDQRGPRVGAEAEAVRGAAGDGQDVLQRAAELRADDVRGSVDAEVPRGQGHLDLFGHLWREMEWGYYIWIL